MRKLLILLLCVITVFSCTTKKRATKPLDMVKLNVAIDYYGNENPTSGELDSAVSIKVYKTSADLDSDTPTSEYNGGKFISENLSSVNIPLNGVVVVTLTKKDEGVDKTYIFEGDDYNFATPSDDKTITMSEEKYLLIIFSKTDLNPDTATGKEKITFSNNSEGGDVELSVVRLRDNAVLEDFLQTIPGKKSNFKIDVPKYFINNARYEIQMTALPELSSYRLDNWNMDANSYMLVTNSSDITFAIPKEAKGDIVISVTFRYFTPEYAVGTKPTITDSIDDGTGKMRKWYKIFNKDELLYVSQKMSSDATDNDGTYGDKGGYNNGNYYETLSTKWTEGRYILMNDIDYGGEWHMPLSSFNSFKGVINGNGYSIKNAKFGTVGTVGSYYSGFIAKMSGGTVSNLTIDSSVVIDTSAEYIGAIAGSLDGGISTIVNCVNNASIVSYNGKYVGGILGSSSCSKISNVYNAGNITVASSSSSSGSVGGIIGEISGRTQERSRFANMYNTGDIKFSGAGSYNVGGVVGLFNGAISTLVSLHTTNAYSMGKIEANTDYVGGIIGQFKAGNYDTFKSLYFVNKNSLPSDGFATGATEKPAGVEGAVANIATKLIEFNGNTPTVWQVSGGDKLVIPNIGKK